MNNSARILTIVGPTASGKTHRAVDLARALDGEIISGDSRQVYRSMDLGTGKDLEEYGEVPYHLIDILPAGQKYNLHQFLADADHAYTDIISRHKTPILCGGTGLYVESFLKGILMPDVPENPELRNSLQGKSLHELAQILASMKALHNVTDLDSAKRAIRAIEIQRYYLDHPDEAARVDTAHPRPTVVIGIDIDREERRNRISARMAQRFNSGMTAEVESLLASGIAADDLIYYGLEYKFITLFVIGKISRKEMETGLETAIHQFAKRQMTWFRGMEKRGIPIHWLPFNLPDSEFVAQALELYNSPSQ